MGRTVILVEGESDKAALAATSQLLGIDLSDVAILVMGGATNFGRFVSEAVGRGTHVAGLYDAGERRYMVRALKDAGLIAGGNLEEKGFFECDPDLEAELISALGAPRVVELVAELGSDLRRFRTMQQMPEWRGRPVEDQLRRWFGSGGGRKTRYAALLVDAMEPTEVPRPLVAVLDHAVGTASS